MRVLLVVKTTEGGLWAAAQARALVHLGADVHVALPPESGQALGRWRASGATLHEASLDLPTAAPWQVPAALDAARRLVERVRPDIIHSYALGTTLVLRHALGRAHPVPRVFQVLGPLHLEYAFYRRLELASAGPGDAWIAASRCVWDRLVQAGAPIGRVFLSYPGMDLPVAGAEGPGVLRRRLGVGDGLRIVGNINYLYAPKRLLGQTRGIKNHEGVIEALAMVLARRQDVVGVLAGGPWNGADAYERKLRRMAARVGHGRILMPGYLPHEDVVAAWADFDCAVHVPLSENMGGVLEPLLAGVPTIAGRVGALGELVIDGVTGRTVDSHAPAQVADAINEVLDDLPSARALAARGRALARVMFDVQRTAREVWQVYTFLRDPSRGRPAGLDSAAFLASAAGRSLLA